MKVFEYFKSTLDKNQASLYDFIYKELKNMCFEIHFNGFDMDEISNIYTAIYLDHPELYYISSDVLIEQEDTEFDSGKVETKSSIKVKDLYPGDIKKEIIKRFNLAVTRIKKILPENPNPVEIEIAILKYITKICVQESNDELNQNAASVLAFGKAQCTGYAKAFSLLMNKFGIECFVAKGEAYNYDTCDYQPHVWNIVKLKGKYYHVDTNYALEFRLINKNLNFEYFNIPDKEIKKTHRWDDKYPICSDNHFVDFNHKEPINNKVINRVDL